MFFYRFARVSYSIRYQIFEATSVYSILSNTIFISHSILVNFTVGRIIEKLESNEFDHTFSREELDVVGILGLLLSQSKDGSTEPGIESVVEEFADGHFIDLRLVILAWLYQFLQILKHLVWMATLHDIVIHVHFLLLLGLDLRIEVDFVIELHIDFSLLSVEFEVDLLDLCVIAQQDCESVSSL